ncbi:lon-related putative ATP-dependent protease [Microbulbifer donghaiensis]|uniref:endopeptidase La n=1 Tax=Microbulbifer donghaiensis TaxID=494016 RepID=A0A1M4YD44_9GAMM|nr:ATP-binding protein [Microbulbifer donghaiensis]SHF03660.1 lon-related putative ATP-dependent protease [Microbulbifer donghaiensis]
MNPVPLTPEQLYQHCPLDWLQVQAEEVEVAKESRPLGQERALDALEFALDMSGNGYNLYVAGSVGLGKHALVNRRIADWAKRQDQAADLCYIHNFDAEHKPHALVLPAGTARQLKRDTEDLLEHLLTAVPDIFRSDEYRARRDELKQQLEDREEQAFADLVERARDLGIGLVRTPSGYTIGPLVDGEFITPKEFAELPEAEQQRLKENIEKVNVDLKETLAHVLRWHEKLAKDLKRLNREYLHLTLDERIDWLRRRYQNLEQVQAFIENIKRGVIENADDFRAAGEQGQKEGVAPRKLIRVREFNRFRVNILVDNGDVDGAPVIYEDNPTYTNLLGRVEHESQMGTLITNFKLIKGGALHRANGGCLVLDAHRVLMTPFAWETLKRALRSRELKIQPLEMQMGLLSTITLEPEPIPLNVNVVLIGDRWLYYLLKAHDPEAKPLFKVYADFAEDIARERDNVATFARSILGLVQRERLRPLVEEALARIVEQAARLAGDAHKLSLHGERLADLVREADYWCRREGCQQIEKSHVQKAIEQREYRQRQWQERMQESITRNILMIDTAGEQVAQINGLSVIQLGDMTFGRPSRITATARLGSGKMVDIERESELGGPLHSKGVMILSAFLANRYTPSQPFSLSASLVFEQSYGPIDGDSASLAELCALLSAIAKVPLRQSIAVTGSVNQLGMVQAVGGVNEKIEGFFDICEARGLSGEQGVIIPAANIQHLMLKEEVVQAAREKKFSVFAVATVDEAIALLTGLAAGVVDEQGGYPEDSFNGRVQKRLGEFEETRSHLLEQEMKDATGEGGASPPATGADDDSPGRDRY